MPKKEKQIAALRVSSATIGHTLCTPRGFEIVNFIDSHGEHCTVQQSSAMGDHGEAPGTAYIWLGCSNADPRVLVPGTGWQPVPMPEGYVANTRMHLSRADVKALVNTLQNWLKTGSFDARRPE